MKLNRSSENLVRPDTDNQKDELDGMKKLLRDICHETNTLKLENSRLYGQLKGTKEGQEMSVTDKNLKILMEEIGQTKKGNAELVKKLKKAQIKADERKVTLKQLFELVMEKDKEISSYKMLIKDKEDSVNEESIIQKLIANKTREFDLKFEHLEKRVLEKEIMLTNLETKSNRIYIQRNYSSPIKLPKAEEPKKGFIPKVCLLKELSV